MLIHETHGPHEIPFATKGREALKDWERRHLAGLAAFASAESFQEPARMPALPVVGLV
jgi:hypothetical protein